MERRHEFSGAQPVGTHHAKLRCQERAQRGDHEGVGAGRLGDFHPEIGLVDHALVPVGALGVGDRFRTHADDHLLVLVAGNEIADKLFEKRIRV